MAYSLAFSYYLVLSLFLWLSWERFSIKVAVSSTVVNLVLTFGVLSLMMIL